MLWFGSPTFWNATVMMTQVVWSFCSSVVGSLWLRSLLVSLLDMFPKRIMSALFWGTGGGELGDSSSVSRPLLLEAGLDFVLPFGVIGASSFLESSPFSSSSFFCLGTTRHSSVECPFCLWKVHNLLGLKADSQFYVELLIAKECWPWVDGSLMLGCLLLTLKLFLLALYYSFRAATSSLCDAKYEARWIASSSEVGAQTAISSLNLDENQTTFFNAARVTLSFKCEIMALMSLNLLMYVLRGSNGTCLRFHISVSVALVSIKAEYCFRKADTSWVKLSIEFPSRPANHYRAGPEGFLRKRQ